VSQTVPIIIIAPGDWSLSRCSNPSGIHSQAWSDLGPLLSPAGRPWPIVIPRVRGVETSAAAPAAAVRVTDSPTVNRVVGVDDRDHVASGAAPVDELIVAKNSTTSTTTVALTPGPGQRPKLEVLRPGIRRSPFSVPRSRNKADCVSSGRHLGSLACEAGPRPHPARP